MKRATGIVAAIVFMQVATAGQAAAPAKVNLTQDIQDLRASALVLTSGKLESQGAALDAIVARIADWTQSHQTVRKTDLGDLEKLADRMRRAATMFSGSNMNDRSTILSAQADVVDRVCKDFATVAEDVAPSASAPATGAAKGGLARLTVRLTIGPQPADTGMPGGGVPGAAPAMPGAAGQMPAAMPPVAGEGRMMGGEGRMGAEGRGMYGGPRQPAMAGAPGMGFAGSQTPRVRMGLVIALVEMNRSFFSPADLRVYVMQNAEKLGQTAISFEVSPEVTWKDVAQVINAFSGAEFSGPMEFAGLNVRGGLAAAAAPAPTDAAAATAQPATPGWMSPPAAMATPSPAAAPTAAPAGATASPAAAAPTPADAAGMKLSVTPLGPGQGELPPAFVAATAPPEFSSEPLADVPLTPDGKLPQALATFLAGKRSVLISYDVDANTTPAARKMVDSALEALGADATISVHCTNTDAISIELIKQKPNTLQTREDLKSMYLFATPPEKPGMFGQAASALAPAGGYRGRMGEGAGPEMVGSPVAAAALVIADGARMTARGDADAIAHLTQMPTALVIIDRAPRNVEQAVGAAKGLTVVYLPAKQLAKIGGGS